MTGFDSKRQASLDTLDHLPYQGRESRPDELAKAVAAEPLTDDELRECFTGTNTAEPLSEGWPGLKRFARAIEQAHGIGSKP